MYHESTIVELVMLMTVMWWSKVIGLIKSIPFATADLTSTLLAVSSNPFALIRRSLHTTDDSHTEAF